MATQSGIEWTEVTWNPVTGCTKISAGCKNCYAERLAKRLQAIQSIHLERTQIDTRLPCDGPAADPCEHSARYCLRPARKFLPKQSGARR